MRRSDRELSQEQARDILARGTYAVVSTTDEDGAPYGVPVNYVADGDHVYLHGTVAGGERSRDLARDPRACLTVVGSAELLPGMFSTRYESVVVRGRASVVVDESAKRAALLRLADMCSPGLHDKAIAYVDAAWDRTEVIDVAIEAITGKARR